MQYQSLTAIQSALKAGQTTVAALVEGYLQKIEAYKHLNVFLEVFVDEARDRAREIDDKISKGTAGKLAGMVLSIKDIICYQDHQAQAGSKILEGFVSQISSTAVERAINEDAIIIGRANCDEFGMGSSNENSAYGPVINGAGENRVPGGSSGGSAVSVQMDMCLVSLGSDTGGSVRQPAAFCGVVGFKPTYSRISRHGLIAYASSFDTIGVLSKNVEDCALLMEVISGEDEFDSTVSRKEVPAYSKLLDNQKKYKIAYLNETLNNEGLDPEIKRKTLGKINSLQKKGHQVEAVDFPLMKYALPTYYILITAEASSNLSRFDGVKFGYRSPNAHNLESMYKKTRSEAFGEEVKRRIMLGTFVLSASYYDAYYTKAQRVRRLIKNKLEELLNQYDFILLPTTPTTAFQLGDRNENPLEMYLADLFTVQASVAGLPAISIPNGTDSNGLPVGLQVMGNFFSEENLLSFSKYLMNN
ncbi:MAG: Asp-tRNA(Asn)/Glu-tRNA(Gln) amidotransferase subunit GatA [Cyclobacteriaceae bacterium]